MTLTRNMKIGIKKIVTYKVDEVRAKKFYDRVMSEKNPIVTLKQIVELRQTYVFRNMSMKYNADRDGVEVVMDGKEIQVLKSS